MKSVAFAGLALFLAGMIFTHAHSRVPQQAVNSFPGPDFALNDASSSPVQVSSLSFSADGKTLAVGILPARVDLWDVESRTKLRSFDAGPACALSADGRILATGGKIIEIWDASSGKRIKIIPWKPKTANGAIDNLQFNPTGTMLDVAVNGEGISIYEIPSGKLLTVLENAERAQFSNDGSLLIGGNAKHLTVWSTQDWHVVRDLPIAADDVTTIAAFPEKDLVVVGGAKTAHLLFLSSAHEIATLGNGFTKFAAFSKKGAIVLTYNADGFGVWNVAGNKLCTQPTIGNSTMAVSADDRWLAASVTEGKAPVEIWDLQKALQECGANSPQASGPPATVSEKSLIAQGRSRFLAYKCDECHGENGEGGPDGPDLVGTHLNATEISKFIEKPSPDAYMKGMPNIPVDSPDHQPLVAYVVSLKRVPTPK